MSEVKQGASVVEFLKRVFLFGKNPNDYSRLGKAGLYKTGESVFESGDILQCSFPGYVREVVLYLPVLEVVDLYKVVDGLPVLITAGLTSGSYRYEWLTLFPGEYLYLVTTSPQTASNGRRFNIAVERK